MAIYAYLRVSCGKQSTDTQEHDLVRRYPEAVIYKETASGVKDRPTLQELLKTVQPGDTIVIAALDRLGRRLRDILFMLEELAKRKINIISLREGIDYTTPGGRMMAQMIGVMAEFEREMISQRTRNSLQMLKSKGVKLGRPDKYSAEEKETARKLRADGLSLRQISAQTGISVGQVATIVQK